MTIVPTVPLVSLVSLASCICEVLSVPSASGNNEDEWYS